MSAASASGGERAAYRLVLLRHGESVWNERGLFTGWVDVGLSERGLSEAAQAGTLLGLAGLLPDIVHTSVLARAIETAEIALRVAERRWIPVRRSWRLNERHYGELQGKGKEQIRREFGEEQFMAWRRSYDVPPPAACARLRVRLSRATRATACSHPTSCRPPSASRTCSSACSPTGTTRSCPTFAAAASCSSPRMATRCAPW